jgi:DNA-binding HxlR family transcriptional regulator
MSSQDLLHILGQSYTLAILETLSKEPKRFVELGACCRSNRTRSARLKELEKQKLVRTVPKMIGRRAYTFYEITPLGKRALELCRAFLQFRFAEKEQS